MFWRACTSRPANTRRNRTRARSGTGAPIWCRAWDIAAPATRRAMRSAPAWAEATLGGGAMGEQGWHAPALGGVRDTVELAALLQTGVSGQDAVAGPMAEVVGASLQHLAADDVGAITHYLVSLPAAQHARA
ncbi:hypothetical protein LP420_35985 [Massilia sp. B-10]|nr:hypothetical protein LP420_35985 [Massilia sp. B-10]